MKSKLRQTNGDNTVFSLHAFKIFDTISSIIIEVWVPFLVGEGKIDAGHTRENVCLGPILFEPHQSPMYCIALSVFMLRKQKWPPK